MQLDKRANSLLLIELSEPRKREALAYAPLFSPRLRLSVGKFIAGAGGKVWVPTIARGPNEAL